jgi:PAS domain S-box-containing protein
MAHKEDDRTETAACESQEKIRRLESERDAALTRLREMEQHCRTFHKEVNDEAELRTRATMDLLEGITQGTGDLIAAKDTNFRLMFFNEAFREVAKRIHGLDIELGQNTIESLSHNPQDQERLRNLWNRAYSGEAFTILQELGDPDRSREIYEIRFNPLRDAEGKIIGASHIVRNVTERVRAEEELQQSRRRFRDLVETISDFVWEVDEKGVFSYASPRVRDLLGYQPEEMIGKTVFDLMPAPEGESVREIFGEIVMNREPLRALECTLRHKNGQTVVLETSGVPFFDTEGNLLGYRGVDRDITARKEMGREREELQEEIRRRLGIVEAIFEATQDGIAIYDGDGKILRMNAACDEMLGFSPEELALDIDRRWALLQVTKMDGTPLPPDEIPSKKALAGEKAQAILHFQPPRRPARWFSVSAAPIRTAGANPARGVVILTDITDFHALQQEHEIFMQMISHDLQTPVTVIQGHAELLNERLPEQDEMTALNLEAIMAATRRLTGMMEDLVRMIHLERGQLPLDFEHIDLAEFISTLVRRMAVLGIGRGVEEIIPPDLPPVWADAESLERILANLITNAVKYSPADCPVRLTAEAAGKEVRISVRDCGKGISPEDQPHLFERFFRGRDAGQKRGIGLGLYITRSLVEAHGGGVWVESEPGKGSVFTFTLPIGGGENAQSRKKDP